MRYGFTGTRKGMRGPQMKKLVTLLMTSFWETLKEADHGDCVGSDKEFHDILRTFTTVGKDVIIYVHPPVDNTYRAFCRGDYIYPPMPYLGRNADINARCDHLIACPSSMTPNDRGGTWWTYKDAVAKGKPTTLILPNGVIQQ